MRRSRSFREGVPLARKNQHTKDVVLDVVGDIPSSFWDSALDIVDAIPNPFSNNKVAAASDSTYSYQIGDNGTTVVFDNEAVPPEVDSIQGVSWGWWGSSTNTLAKDLSPQSRQFKRKIKEKAQSNEGLRYGIGGFYRLKPLGTGLRALAEITIHYAEEELGEVDESELAVYWENTDEGGWEYIGGTVDPDSNTVTAPIDTFRTFTLAPKLPSGSFELQPDTSSIDADGSASTTVQSTTLTHNDGSTVEDGALYTVETTRGDILTSDADTARTGVQVPVSGGKLRSRCSPTACRERRSSGPKAFRESPAGRGPVSHSLLGESPGAGRGRVQGLLRKRLDRVRRGRGGRAKLSDRRGGVDRNGNSGPPERHDDLRGRLGLRHRRFGIGPILGLPP